MLFQNNRLHLNRVFASTLHGCLLHVSIFRCSKCDWRVASRFYSSIPAFLFPSLQPHTLFYTSYFFTNVYKLSSLVNTYELANMCVGRLSFCLSVCRLNVSSTRSEVLQNLKCEWHFYSTVTISTWLLVMGCSENADTLKISCNITVWCCIEDTYEIRMNFLLKL